MKTSPSAGSQAKPVPEARAASEAPVTQTVNRPSESLLLLVEDNRDLREFISSELEGSFRIETAEDAARGLEKARELIPDLVITDVVMPRKTGFELCSELKHDLHTSHIPVILLTALRSEKHKLLAYESGADDFITKPVSPEILRLKVRNLLATQKHSRERVRQQFVEDNRITGLSESDQAFLDKAKSIVDDELSSELFDVNALAEKMGFSRSAFYRKFNSLTDLSPASFIRTKRLRQAAKWLAEGDKSVSEIAFDVGFSDAGYFSRVFKDEYKCSPSEFAKKGDT
jgi:DNA-binding response OmpR family regulator